MQNMDSKRLPKLFTQIIAFFLLAAACIPASNPLPFFRDMGDSLIMNIIFGDIKRLGLYIDLKALNPIINISLFTLMVSLGVMAAGFILSFIKGKLQKRGIVLMTASSVVYFIIVFIDTIGMVFIKATGNNYGKLGEYAFPLMGMLSCVLAAALFIFGRNTFEKKPKGYITGQIAKDYKMNKFIIFMSLPIVIYYIIFNYVPMYGVMIGFQDFSVAKTILGSNWVGMKNIIEFFSGTYWKRTIINTLMINFYQLIFSFPAPIILAVLLNEVKNKFFKKTVQTITYLPHFISTVIICGMVLDFFSLNGLINEIAMIFGATQKVQFMVKPEYYRAIYVGTGIWAGVGWGSIIYLAALSGINQEIYEAVAIDGGGRWKQFWHVTLPGITPTIVILLIFNIGGMMSEGAEKTILIYNELTYSVSDIISSYVYRRGLVQGNYSFSAAVGLFSTVINLILITIANKVSDKLTETSLW